MKTKANVLGLLFSASLCLPAAHAQRAGNSLVPPGGTYRPGPGGSGASTGTTAAPAAPAASGNFGHSLSKAHLWLRKAHRARDQGDLAKASSHLEKILALPFPDDAQSRRFLGPVACNLVVLLKGQGKWREAEEATRLGLSRIERPGVPVTYHVMLLHSLRGEVLEQLGRPGEARQAHQRAEQLELELEAEN